MAIRLLGQLGASALGSFELGTWQASDYTPPVIRARSAISADRSGSAITAAKSRSTISSSQVRGGNS